jgi:hypothetical protein
MIEPTVPAVGVVSIGWKLFEQQGRTGGKLDNMQAAALPVFAPV